MAGHIHGGSILGELWRPRGWAMCIFKSDLPRCSAGSMSGTGCLQPSPLELPTPSYYVSRYWRFSPHHSVSTSVHCHLHSALKDVADGGRLSEYGLLLALGGELQELNSMTTTSPNLETITTERLELDDGQRTLLLMSCLRVNTRRRLCSLASQPT